MLAKHLLAKTKHADLGPSGADAALMTNQPITVLNLNGIPAQPPRTRNDPFFTRDAQGAWQTSSGDLTFEIEAECLRIGDALASTIFGGSTAYYASLRSLPFHLLRAGLDSETTTGAQEFSKELSDSQDSNTLFRMLYLEDSRNLVTSIQECLKEVTFLQGEFYRSLNLDTLFSPPIDEPDGLRWVTSPVVTNIHATLGFIFIRLHSLLDYTTRLVYETDRLRTSFDSYVRLVSKSVQYGDRKRISLSGASGTLFEPCDLLTQIELFRNRIIHEGLFDDLPKIYKMVQGGTTVEKFILFPDRGPEGQFERVKNRCLFFSREDKINLRLPFMISEFQSRLLSTLKLIMKGSSDGI